MAEEINLNDVGKTMKTLCDSSANVGQCKRAMSKFIDGLSHIEEQLCDSKFRMAFLCLDRSRYMPLIQTTELFDALLELGVECRTKFHHSVKISDLFDQDNTSHFVMK